jgi:hypothetical protein
MPLSSHRLFLELAAREETACKCLAHRHLELFRLKLVRSVHNRACWKRYSDAIAPDGRDWLIVVRRVHDNACRPSQPPVPAWDEHVHSVGNVVTEVVQDKRTLMGNDGFFRSDGKPSLADVVVLAARETTDAVKTAADPLKPAGTNMMI